MLDEAEADLERAFDYYQQRREGLGVELVEEFRRAVDLILAHPRGWQPLDEINAAAACTASPTASSIVSTPPPTTS